MRDYRYDYHYDDLYHLTIDLANGRTDDCTVSVILTIDEHREVIVMMKCNCLLSHPSEASCLSKEQITEIETRPCDLNLVIDVL